MRDSMRSAGLMAGVALASLMLTVPAFAGGISVGGLGGGLGGIGVGSICVKFDTSCGRVGSLSDASFCRVARAPF